MRRPRSGSVCALDGRARGRAATRRHRKGERSRTVSAQGNWMHSRQTQTVPEEEPDARTDRWLATWPQLGPERPWGAERVSGRASTSLELEKRTASGCSAVVAAEEDAAMLPRELGARCNSKAGPGKASIAGGWQLTSVRSGARSTHRHPRAGPSRPPTTAEHVRLRRNSAATRAKRKSMITRGHREGLRCLGIPWSGSEDEDS